MRIGKRIPKQIHPFKNNYSQLYKNDNEHYFYEGTEVIKYAKPTSANREIITEKMAPKWVQFFLEIIKKEKLNVLLTFLFELFK